MNKETDSKLKECPFCHSPHVNVGYRFAEYDGCSDGYLFTCYHCNTEVIIYEPTIERAIEVWNGR